MKRPIAPPRTPGPCSIDGCDSPKWNAVWCNMHYQRNRRHGSPHITLRQKRATAPKPKPIPYGMPVLGAIGHLPVDETTARAAAAAAAFGPGQPGLKAIVGRGL